MYHSLHSERIEGVGGLVRVDRAQRFIGGLVGEDAARHERRNVLARDWAAHGGGFCEGTRARGGVVGQAARPHDHELHPAPAKRLLRLGLLEQHGLEHVVNLHARTHARTHGGRQQRFRIALGGLVVFGGGWVGKAQERWKGEFGRSAG